MKRPVIVVPSQEAFQALLINGPAHITAAGRCGGSGRCASPKSASRRNKLIRVAVTQ